MTDRTGLSGWVHKLAGPDLEMECAGLDPLRTGEAVMTAGYRLPARYGYSMCFIESCRHVIHTVAPRYKPQYRTAAENALHHCYRNSFQLVKESQLTNLAFPCIQSSKSYPKEDACHIAVRTVRRLLERWCDGIDCIILVVANDNEWDLYQSILPLYFPRYWIAF